MTDRVKWGPGRRERFRHLCRDELDRALGGRSSAEGDWTRWMEQYRAPASSGMKHYPFEGASNYIMPITAMNMDPILAMYMGNIHQAQNIWTITPLNENWIKASKPLQDYLQWLDVTMLKMWDVNIRAMREALLLGTSVYKTYWFWETRNVTAYDGAGNRVRQARTFNKPIVDHVNLADFLVPPEARAIQPDDQGGATWVAERHRMTAPKLKIMGKGQEPFLPNFEPDEVEKATRWFETGLTDREAAENKLDAITDDTGRFDELRPIEIWEVHMRFDTTGSGVEDDIIVHFHKDTAAILRAVYNHHPGGRPYDVIRYLRGDGFYGIGVAEQCDMWQQVISDVMNFDIDKIILSHSPMWSASEGANILPDEPIFPGKIWFRNEPDDIQPLSFMSGGNHEVLQLIGLLQNGADARTGVGDLQRSNITSLPSRTPATTVNNMLQQSNTRFDMSIKDLRMGGLSNVGLRILQNLQEQSRNFQNNPFADAYASTAAKVLGMPEGQEVASVLMNPPNESIEFGVGVQLTATSGTNNREMQRQSKLALLQLGSQMGEQFINLAGLIQQGGAVGETAIQLFQGGAELLRQVLEEFDVRNPEEFIPNLQSLLQTTQGLGGGGGVPPGAQQGGGQGPPGTGGF